MFNRVKQIIWPEIKEKKKRQEFIDRLKGISEIQIRRGTAIGVIVVVLDSSTGHIDNYFHITPNKWISWGSSPKLDDELVRTFTKRQLEIYLTNLYKKTAPNGQITMLDESCCIQFGK